MGRRGRLPAEAAKGLEGAGAECVLICTNTMHKVADMVRDAVSVPLLHLADATAGAVLRTGRTTVGLLGTAFTMEQDFYRSRLSEHGLAVLVPQDDSPVPVYPTTRLHAEAAVTWSLTVPASR